MLTKRENMLEVLRGGSPDRFVKQYEAIRFITKTPYTEKYPEVPAGPGAPAVKTGWGFYNSWPAGQPGPFPLHDSEHLACPDITRWREYVHAPSLDFTEEDWRPCVEEAAKIDRSEYLVTAFNAPGMFELSHHLCEMQNAMMNLILEPEAVHELLDYISDWYLAYYKQICEHLKPDAFFQHDDWGSQRSPFVSNDMFEEFLLEPYKKIYGYLHDQGVIVIHHNDSFCAPLVPYMIEMGIDVWQGCLSGNDLPELIKKYGKDITFMGGVDCGLVDREDATEETISQVVEPLCKACGPLHFIPCSTQGGNMTTYPHVYPLIDQQIDKMSKELF